MNNMEENKSGLVSSDPCAVDELIMKELKLKYHCVWAYLLFLVARMILFFLADKKVMDFYEYLTCSVMMFCIILLYQCFER